ncbi:hypothetical protein BHE74_00028972 [Ensete ventricosum]|nr:hypothetical protein GW17_00024913 [Ensete ventricosum]RWW63833.1 hypothetical protein BHE74_00028972 [Ensete ventricosum]RZS06836.1 hypothetical protein BHM03_00037566 [Ensete ventricosum]
MPMLTSLSSWPPFVPRQDKAWAWARSSWGGSRAQDTRDRIGERMGCFGAMEKEKDARHQRDRGARKSSTTAPLLCRLYHYNIRHPLISPHHSIHKDSHGSTIAKLHPPPPPQM